MKKLVTLILSGLIVFVLVLCFASSVKSEENIDQYLVKYKSEWNEPCSQCPENSPTYRAYFRNDYTGKLDIKCAAQENDKRWRTFSKLDMVPGDTIVAYACKGNGKFMKWVRKAGDKTFVFPGDEEINNVYGK